jgi:hypothetical protein
MWGHMNEYGWAGMIFGMVSKWLFWTLLIVTYWSSMCVDRTGQQKVGF